MNLFNIPFITNIAFFSNYTFLIEVPTQVVKNNDNTEDNGKEEEQIDDVEEEEIMDDEEEMEIPSPEDGSPDHFVIQGAPVISSPPQMVSPCF